MGYTKATPKERMYYNMAVINVTNINFEEIAKSDKPVLLDFYADWCNPCRMVAPLVHEIAEEHPEYVIGKINVDTEAELAARFGIVSIPTLVVLREGKIAAQSAGARPKAQILAMLEG